MNQNVEVTISIERPGMSHYPSIFYSEVASLQEVQLQATHLLTLAKVILVISQRKEYYIQVI